MISGVITEEVIRTAKVSLNTLKVLDTAKIPNFFRKRLRITFRTSASTCCTVSRLANQKLLSFGKLFIVQIHYRSEPRIMSTYKVIKVICVVVVELS